MWAVSRAASSELWTAEWMAVLSACPSVEMWAASRAASKELWMAEWKAVLTASPLAVWLGHHWVALLGLATAAKRAA